MIYTGNVIDILPTIADNSVDCVVTSPPYFGLRDYGNEHQIGLEPTVQEYVDKLVLVFKEIKRCLKSEGTVWLNLGDSYNGSGKGLMADGSQRAGLKQATNKGSVLGKAAKTEIDFLKPKDLIGIPWRVAFALQADGWYLRQDIIWAKGNPLPESVKDRCTKSHEYIFLLSKSPKYYFDINSIKEKAVGNASGNIARKQRPSQETLNKGHQAGSIPWVGNEYRQKRSVWTVNIKPFKGAHFATFPVSLIEPCILAGCPEGGVVLDPFFGSGTVGVAALSHNRKYLGIELNTDYVKIAETRLAQAKTNLFIFNE